MATAVEIAVPAGRNTSPTLEFLDAKQKGLALEVFQRINIDGRGKLYPDELVLVFESAGLPDELAMLQGVKGGITDEDWLDYLRRKKRRVGASKFKGFLQGVSNLVSQPGTRSQLEQLRAERKALSRAEQMKRNSVSVGQRLRRMRSAPLVQGPMTPTMEVVKGLKNKQSPWPTIATAEDRVVVDVYEEHSAQRARIEQEDEQEALDILDDEQSAPSGDANSAPASKNQLPTNTATPQHTEASGSGELATGVAAATVRQTFEEAGLPALRLYVMQPYPPEWTPAVRLPWNPPTSDPDCLEAVAYLQFCRQLVPSLRYEMSTCANEYVAPNGSLPSLLINREKVIVPHKQLVDAMKNLLIRSTASTEGAQYEGASHEDPVENTMTLNEALNNRVQEYQSEDPQHQERAIAALVEQSLRPLLLYLWWVDDSAASDSSVAYARGMPFVQRQILPRQRRQRVLNRLESTGQDDWGRVLQRAEQALRALTGFLDDRAFFFGDTPTAIDAKVLGHLIPLTQAPPGGASSPPLTKQSWPRLFRYVERCCQLLKDLESLEDSKELQPVECRLELEASAWVNRMATKEAEGSKPVKRVVETWFDSSKVLAPFLVAGVAFFGFMLLRRSRQSNN
eukprot:TRINITY_DN19018_c0_g1_i2.p1 TRINITY_DN19018_c0_g1~~TRINITY_DN19018_c0_g1_i2.p1  ORF type:complete len:624 (+),score=139.30 TRINITY_DN19018_c0_g1_i2:183-2054(+)